MESSVKTMTVNRMSEQAKLLEPVAFLIVEDNPEHAEIAMRVVKKSGFCRRIDHVNNGAEALDYLQNQGKYQDKTKYPLPDIILTDIDMPVMDGFETVEKIKSIKALEHIPILSVSSHFDNNSRLRMLRLGAVDSIVKPFNPEELQARIGTHIKLKQVNERMVRAEKRYVAGLVSSGISHEIRNRFNSIKMAMYVLRGKIQVDDETGVYISGIEDEITRGTKLVDELLKFSDPRPPCFEKLSVRDIVQYLENMIRSQVKPEIVLNVKEVPDDMPFIHGDSMQLIQALSNIAMNAIEAMPEGGELGIEAEHLDDAGMVSVVISDTGAGMTEDVINKIYDPFFSTKEMGSGLGLSVCMSLIKEHGGELFAESEPGNGSRFITQIPVYRD